MSVDARADATDQLGGAPAPGYSRRVGERLRAIRRQRRLSLQEVEARSGQEFKASVLGAYERGERSISVPRLQRLARLYDVPVDQLLPDDGVDAPVRPVPASGEGGDPITIDLHRLGDLSGPEAGMLHRYLAMIQVQRQDVGGRALTIRREDLPTIACMLGVPAEDVGGRLAELGLRLA